MYIKIRKADARNGDDDILITISKKAQIQELRDLIFKEIHLEQDRQRLYYKGKLLVNDHCILDYGIKLNEVVQLTEQNKKEKPEDSNLLAKETSTDKDSINWQKADSRYYKIGDQVDFQDIHGAWFEAEMTDILRKQEETCETIPEDYEQKNFLFKIILLSDDSKNVFDAEFHDVRPRSIHAYDSTELKSGLKVLLNYNIENPNSVGYWYDFEINEASAKTLTGTLFLGKIKTALENLNVKIRDSVWKIEKPSLLSENVEKKDIVFPELRKVPYYCSKCKDDASKNCKECGCRICSGKSEPRKLLLCDECNYGYHLFCLSPPLSEVPQDPEWYCPSCKTDENEIVKAGDKLKSSKLKKEEGHSRDWGQGMACVGRTKECTIVPKNHTGIVPGVEVGTCWKFRHQASEAGIHRPLVAGIHGRETECAYSLVLSGGYEDDVDNGEEFYYTGSGGRDLSGNKRVSDQSSDQTLTRMNKALALNCNAKFNNVDGAEATNWKAGKPVRVVRNFKLGKHSKYAPKDGNRYDGTYKVVKYFPQKGKSGFIVWRYLLRRDDPSPPPWSKEGQEFEMAYPPGYLDAQALKEKQKNKENPSKRKGKSVESKQGGIKRLLFNQTNLPSPKKIKSESYTLSSEIETKIKDDTENNKLWNECKEMLAEGKSKFLNKVEEVFMCICCQELLHLPVTTECKHNVCKDCLKRSFNSEIYTCPYCRFELGQNYKSVINNPLTEVLKVLFPGYELSR